MTRKVFLMLFFFLPFARIAAQISEIEQVFHSTTDYYEQYTSIARNYNDKYNVLMQYGQYQNVYYGDDDSIRGFSSFMIQNTSNGDITHIVDLPRGYQVNDVRFVTLRKIDGVSTEDFCVFCGTRTRFDGIFYLPALPNQPSTYYYAYSKHGFAGFFSMKDALSPTTSFTAKVRDVEQTKELYRMTCYPEEYGLYYPNQNAFIDNAVLDIIGLDDTLNKPSCFCRVKFYPVYGSAVRWDNNMRYNDNEVLTDITKTDNYVVATSHNVTSDSLWIRYSDQEDHHYPGGLELNDYVNSIDFSRLTMQTGCDASIEIENFSRCSPAKLCHIINDEIEVGYCMTGQSYGGLLNSQYDYSNGTLYFSQGAYLKGTPLVKELIHLPENNATAILYNDISDYITVLNWKLNNNSCNYPVKMFYNNNCILQSLTLQERNGYEHLFWTGMESGNSLSPMYIMSQRGEQGGGYEKTCHSKNDDAAFPVNISHTINEKILHIKKRYAYDDVTYPVAFIHFTPYDIEKEFICIEK